MLFFATLLPPAAAAFEITLDPPEPRPGDILRVEVLGIDNPKRMVCRFREKELPFFAVGPGRLRALIGLTARFKPGWYQLEVSRKRFLLPREHKTVGVTVMDRGFSHQELTMPAGKTGLAGKPGAQTALEIIRDTLKEASPRQRWKGSFAPPVTGRRTSAYGHTRTINRSISWDWHKGIDLAAESGRSVLAPNDGVVVLAARFPVQGGIVILDHGQGVMSTFLHLKSFAAGVGEEVPKGRTIATVGGEGFSTGSHLHWGVYVHGEAVDPEPLLKRNF